MGTSTMRRTRPTSSSSPTAQEAIAMRPCWSRWQNASRAAGVNTLRCDLPFRQRRPTGPPSPSGAKQDQEGLRRAVTLMRQRFNGRAYLGGVSYGGRQASMLVASEPELVQGLLLLSYPLHPPGRAAQLRTAHFPEPAHAHALHQRHPRRLRQDRRIRSGDQADPSAHQADPDWRLATACCRNPIANNCRVRLSKRF